MAVNKPAKTFYKQNTAKKNSTFISLPNSNSKISLEIHGKKNIKIRSNTENNQSQPIYQILPLMAKPNKSKPNKSEKFSKSPQSFKLPIENKTYGGIERRFQNYLRQ